MINRFLSKLRGPDPRLRFADVETWKMDIVARATPFSMTSQERLLATVNATEYVIHNEIPGAIVECGVWRGGNMVAASLTLLHLKAQRPLFLFDTFTGMTAPTDADKDASGAKAEIEYLNYKQRAAEPQWCEASVDEVRRNLSTTGYPEHLATLVEGPVEKTLPSHELKAIAFLRLDTDWYESTRHELQHLYPLVSKGGVIAIDDYGHWQGARRAVDEYLSSNGIKCLLHRIDYTAREFVKS